MYTIKQYDEVSFISETYICKYFMPCYLSLVATISPSAEYYRDVIFYYDSRNRAYSVKANNSGETVLIAVFSFFEDAAKSTCLHLISVKGCEIDYLHLSESLKEVIRQQFVDFDLHSLRCNLVTVEQGHIELLKAIGFEEEACLKEQIFLGGRYFDSFVYSIFKDSLC